MHLFQNKKKDVKLFLQEMKANKTNRSSNGPIQTNGVKPKQSQTQDHYNDEQYYSNGIARKVNCEVSRKSQSKAISHADSNRSSNSMTHSNRKIGLQSTPDQPSFRGSQEMNFAKNESQHGFHDNPYQNNREYYDPQSEPLYSDHEYISRSSQNYHPSRESYPVVHQKPNYRNQSPLVYSQRGLDPYFSSQNNFSIQNFSQNSNTSIYEPPQLYQNSNSNYQNFHNSIPLQKTNTMTMQFQNQNRFAIPPRSNSQNHEDIKIPRSASKQFKQNYNNKNFDNSQRHYMSQISNLDFPMEEIQEDEPGLSTQRDSPAKLTQIFSKPKNFTFEVVNTPMKSLLISSVMEVTQHKIQKTRHIPNNPNIQDKKSFQNKPAFSQLYENKKESSQQKNEKQSQKGQFQRPIDLNAQIRHKNHQNQIFKSNNLKVTQEQRSKLSSSFNILHDTRIKVDQFVKQAEIMLNNIGRKRNSFEDNCNDPSGMFYKYLHGDILQQQRGLQNLIIQVEKKQEVKEEIKTVDKKERRKVGRPKKIQTNEQQTLKKDKYYDQIQIQFMRKYISK